MKSKFASLIACGVVALSAAVLPASAVTPVNIAFDIIWAAPLPNGDAVSWGSVTYNGDVVPMSGAITLTSPELIDLFVSINGVEYTEEDDGFYPAFPSVSFIDGELTAFSFLTVGTSVVSLYKVGLGEGGASFMDFMGGQTRGDIVLKGPTTVPDAGSTVAMLGVAFCAVGALRRRMSA